MAVTVMVASTDTERGQLRPSPRLMPGTDTEDSTATVLALAMAAMVVTVLATDMERGLPTLRLMRGTDTVDSMAMVLVLAMVVMAAMALATDTERGQLRPSLRLMRGTDMVAFMAMESQLMVATDMDFGARSKNHPIPRLILCNKPYQMNSKAYILD